MCVSMCVTCACDSPPNRGTRDHILQGNSYKQGPELNQEKALMRGSVFFMGHICNKINQGKEECGWGSPCVWGFSRSREATSLQCVCHLLSSSSSCLFTHNTGSLSQAERWNKCIDQSLCRAHISPHNLESPSSLTGALCANVILFGVLHKYPRKVKYPIHFFIPAFLSSYHLSSSKMLYIFIICFFVLSPLLPCRKPCSSARNSPSCEAWTVQKTWSALNLHS